MAYSRKAEALIESFKAFTLPYDPELLVETMRKEDSPDIHILADLIESLQDQIMVLKFQLRRLEARKGRKGKGK